MEELLSTATIGRTHGVDGFQCLALAVFRGPELAGNPDFLAGDAAFLDGTANTCLVLIGMGGVDVAVARFQCREARLFAHFVTGLEERADAEAGHLHAVVQLDHGHACRRRFLLRIGSAYAAP